MKVKFIQAYCMTTVSIAQVKAYGYFNDDRVYYRGCPVRSSVSDDPQFGRQITGLFIFGPCEK